MNFKVFRRYSISAVKLCAKIYHTITGSSPKHLEILELMDIGIEAFEILEKGQRSDP